MEAVSFGISCIVPDVGSTKEIIYNDVNGILHPKDFHIHILSSWIMKFANISDDQY